MSQEPTTGVAEISAGAGGARVRLDQSCHDNVRCDISIAQTRHSDHVKIP